MLGERPPSADFYYGWWYAGTGQDGTGSCDMVLGAREINAGRPELANCSAAASHFGRGSLSNECDLLHFWSFHTGGANFAYADGSVHFLPYNADAQLTALATRAGGEAVSAADY
jgi:prepilin-type processing-associated H-X9-DG protein